MRPLCRPMLLQIRSEKLTQFVRSDPHFVRICPIREPVGRAILRRHASRQSVPPTSAFPDMRERHGRWEDTMIPGSFSYHRPASVGDAVKLLASLGEDARPLAGGHSLVPMMKLRLATPAHLVDLHGIAGLKGIARSGNTIQIGAMTTQHELLASDEIAKALPILHETALLIADPQVRYRGTIGGNVANGDPGNDMPALMLVLGATYRLEGPAG